MIKRLKFNPLPNSPPPINPRSPDPPPDEQSRLPVSSSNFLTQTRHFFPPAVPLPPPQVVEHLEELPTLERVAESWRYGWQRLEFTVSPQGKLRQWIKINFLLFLWLAIPLAFFIPLSTFALGHFAELTGFVKAGSYNLLEAALPLLLLSALISLIIAFLRR